MAHTRATMEVNRALLDGEARFDLKRQLADTLQGRIYSATDRNSTDYCVVKETWKQLVRMKRSRDGHRVPEDFENEKAIMSYLSNDPAPHPGFVRILDEWEDEHCYFYAMEGCRGGELFQYIKDQHTKGSLQSWVTSQSRLPQKPMKDNNEWTLMVKTMFRQLVDCVAWMHDRGVCHLDLSLENSMIHDRRKKHVKIIDFGLGKYFGTDDLQDINKQYNQDKNDPNNTNKNGKPQYASVDVRKLSFKNNQRVGKTGYMAPEVYDRKEYDARAADIWSLGVMLFMMCIGAPPYEYPTDQNAAFRFIIGGKLADVLKHWKRLRLVTEQQLDLMVKIFKPENERITMEEILAHPFIELQQRPLFVPIAREADYLSMDVDNEEKQNPNLNVIASNNSRNKPNDDDDDNGNSGGGNNSHSNNNNDSNNHNDNNSNTNNGDNNNSNNDNDNENGSSNNNNSNKNNSNNNNNSNSNNENDNGGGGTSNGFNSSNDDDDTDMTGNSNNNQQPNRQGLNNNFQSELAQNFQKHLKNRDNGGVDALRKIMQEVEKKRNEIMQAAKNNRSKDVDIDMTGNGNDRGNDRGNDSNNVGYTNTLQKAMSVEGEDKDDQKMGDVIDPSTYQIVIDELATIHKYVSKQIGASTISYAE